MRIAYLDCASGIAGDMLLGALVDAGAQLAAIQAGVASLGLPGVKIAATEVRRKGFRGLKIEIQHEPQDKHRHLHHIVEMIDGCTLSPRAKELAKRIFTRLGEAEAKVHGIEIRKVHFHEVGAIDSIADIVGSAMGLDLLGIERIEASPVPTGHGFITIAHGRCSVPAPATAELLQGIPLVASDVEAELTTPTGAAILAALAERFGAPPPMTVQKIGYGAGTRDFEQQANLLRILVGDSAEVAKVSTGNVQTETLCLLETNLDDASGEVIGHCATQLFEAGALDVFSCGIQMKKNRPGVLLSVLCQPSEAERMEGIIFRETTTLGVRRSTVSRRKLARKPHTVTTPWGPIDGVLAMLPDGQVRFSPEFESCRLMAKKHHLALRIVFEAALRGFTPSN
ncbi:MAG TPA: nickel pincer cofactor biosynthesis protein LarC [Pirellulales bacterium]|nr:nickel pincer cofactor biosynthesis protein LarC [Pirellulales bacterium]